MSEDALDGRQSMLVDAFRSLRESGVTYCVLRGSEELSEHVATKEVDLLVRSSDLSTFVHAVDENGFYPVPSWGHAPHHFFVAFHKASGTWLKLDVVTDLVYGKPIRFLRLNLADRCLENRVPQGDFYKLSPDDEFTTLLLHCVIDKGVFRASHRERLTSLKETASNNVRLGRRLAYLLAHHLPQAVNYDATAKAIDRGDWQWFLEQQAAIKHKLFWERPLANAWRKSSTALLRRSRPLLFTLRCHGVSIALLAPDGAGKTTLAESLTGEVFLRARRIYMGSNADASTVGSPATAWLKRHAKAIDVNEMRLWRSALKGPKYCNRVLEQWLRYSVGFYHKCLGRFVIFDRYVYDAFLAPPAKTKGKRVRRQLLLKTCPAPDLVIVLDAPGEVLFQRKGEHSPTYLEKQRQVFLTLKEKIPNTIIVDATCAPNQVRCEILERMWQCYGAHAIGR